MAHKVERIARGNTSKLNSYAGPSGELIHDTSNDELVLQNGTNGGVRFTKKSDYLALQTRVTRLESSGSQSSTPSTTIIDARSYGAKGDGVSDDTEALNKALEAARGGELFIPGGTYLTRTGLHIPSHTTVRGAGKGATIIKLSNDAPYDVDCITNEQNWWNRDDGINQYGPWTLSIMNANAGNEYIALIDITADGSGNTRSQGSRGHTGSAIHFANVHHCLLQNVEGIYGMLHCIDISSAMYGETYASSFTDGSSGPWYNGHSSHVYLVNCSGIDPQIDDCITTHYSYDIHIHNCYCYRNLRPSEVNALAANQHGLEVDDGSFDVYVTGGFIENCYEGIQIKGHSTAYPAHDVFVDGLTVRNCRFNFYATCGGTINYKRGRNVTFVNCNSYQTRSQDTDPTFNVQEAAGVNGRHWYIVEYDQVFVQNCRCIGDATQTVDIAFQLSRSCRNVFVNGLFFKDIVTGDGDSEGLIFLNASIGENVQLHNIVASDCYGGPIIRTAVSAVGLVIDGVYGYRESDDGQPMVRISQNTMRNANTIVRNLSAGNGYERAYVESNTSDNYITGYNNNEFEVTSHGKTIWKRAISSSSQSPTVSYPLTLGAYTVSQDLVTGEKCLLGFKHRVASNLEKYVAYVGSYQDTDSETVGNFGVVIGTSNNASLSDSWEFNYSGCLNPMTDGQQNLGRSFLRCNVLFAATGSINTSDEREKQRIEDVPDAVLDAWGDVSLRQFLFNDAVARKGEGARIHMGAIAQEVVAAFASHGLDAAQYGLLCFDKWDDVYRDTVVVDQEGEWDDEGRTIVPEQSHVEKVLVRSAGERYGLRYEECLVLEAAWQRRENRRLNERLERLEQAVADLTK